MDEIPIATSSPVKPVSKSKNNIKVQHGPGTFLNFFIMMPLAMVILVQGFYFGFAIGNYSTFPLYTIQSFFTMATLLTLVILIQMFLRSIVYSTFFSFMLVSGIFHAWFGDFSTPITENLKEIMTIIKSAWSNKDIPYPILMASLISAALGVTVVLNFLLSLFVKYLFEVVFGREWGDGRFKAYISGIIFMLITHLCFLYYYSSVSGKDRILWEKRSLYSPMEEFCTRIPGGVIENHDRIWIFDTKSISANNSLTGTLVREQAIGAEVFGPYFSRLNRPIFSGKVAIRAYERDLVSEIWVSNHLNELPGLKLPEGESASSTGIPLIVRTDLSSDYVFEMFDYGFWGAVSASSGKQLWVKNIDVQTRINRFSLEDYLKNSWICSYKDVVIFSCLHGKIIALNAGNGSLAWEYSHNETKFNGKPQRAFLSISSDKLTAAFPTGQIAVFDAAKGKKISQAASVQWKPITPAYLDKGEAAFVSDEGNYYRVEIDGGKTLIKKLVYDSRPLLMPIPMNLKDGFLSFKDTLYKVNTEKRDVSQFFSFPQHIFAAHPFVDEDFVYFGTQDGWVFCFHKDSLREKWRVRLGGELHEESFAASDFGILVRTRSGTVYCLKKGLS
ncbi:MAG: PQQ-binding-like beta-propeller repeat protein [Candidatus Riflebacteria bacterium]|nr:PQQ-binding-like beta-propeller repeat protein [Candidatus Riflebacteria bacterium]